MEIDQPKVALAAHHNYAPASIHRIVGELLDGAAITIARGEKILVKPNLLMNRNLACTNPVVVAAVCAWLMDNGACARAGDSPGFGRMKTVADYIGLTPELKKLGVSFASFSKTKLIRLEVENKKISLPVAQAALEADRIFSVARVKAHSQMRMTICVKNCFGCVPGLHKAIVHARYGDTTNFFAGCLAALFMSLPPVAGVADGIEAMHVTGPAKGEPFPLGVLGASSSAPALDEAILEIVNVPKKEAPLWGALNRAGLREEAVYPLAKPKDLKAVGFIAPDQLKAVSFGPRQLAKSIMRRIWKNIKN